MLVTFKNSLGLHIQDYVKDSDVSQYQYGTVAE